MSEIFADLPRIKKRPVPATADVTTFDYMPLGCQQLKDSDTWLKATRTPFAAAACINIWMHCWHQVPAGSIAADEDILIGRAGVPDWESVRDIVLRGFIYCEEDGRLYHLRLCDRVLEAVEKQKSRSKRGKAGAEARWNEKRGRKSPVTNEKQTTNDEMQQASDKQCSSNGKGDASAMPKNAKGREGNRREYISPPTPLTDEADATGAVGGGGWLEAEGIPWLASTGLGDQRARSTVNLWLETHPPDVIEDVMRRAQVSPKGDPAAWIGSVLNREAADQYRKVRAAQKPQNDDPPEMRDREGAKWRAVLLNYRDKGFWSEMLNGPKPGEPDCEAPADLVAEILGDDKAVQRKLEGVA